MYIFHTTSGFNRPNISRNTRWNCNFSLPLKNLPLKLHVIQTTLQKLGLPIVYGVGLPLMQPKLTSIFKRLEKAPDFLLSWRPWPRPYALP